MTKRKPESPEPSSPSALIAAVARALDARQIRYLLIGGWAVIEHGYTRTTEDIDLELSLGPWEIELIRSVAQEVGLEPKFPGAFEQTERSLLLPLIHEPSGLGVDVAFSPSDYLEVAIRRAPRHDMMGQAVVVAEVEDLIIRKLIANRPQDRQDIHELLVRHGHRIDQTYLNDWLGRFEEVTDQPLRTLLGEIQSQSRG